MTIDLLKVERGSVTAPAGCGKTRLIADTLTRHVGDKPILVLTHTNSGVAALRERLASLNVPSSAYRLATIDGWSMKLVQAFPTMSGAEPSVFAIKPDYQKLRKAAIRLVDTTNVSDLVKSSYARLLVDEYQDCSLDQHAVVRGIATLIPAIVLGDHMQAIFDIGGSVLVDWSAHVQPTFPKVGQLDVPWRWKNEGTEDLGLWLLKIRDQLEKGEAIDVANAPRVAWVKIPPDSGEAHEARIAAASRKPDRTDGSTLIIGDSTKPTTQQEIARRVYGATAIEAVELRDLMSFATAWDIQSQEALARLVRFAGALMRRTEADRLLKRLSTIQAGKHKNPPSATELEALAFTAAPSYAAAERLMAALQRRPGAQAHRPILLRAFMNALRVCDGSPGNTLLDCVLRERERYRFVGRPLPKRGVGSTLLLKGLEADTVVILHADELDRRNLYVALTRGSRQVVVCSQEAQFHSVD